MGFVCVWVGVSAFMYVGRGAHFTSTSRETFVDKRRERERRGCMCIDVTKLGVWAPLTPFLPPPSPSYKTPKCPIGERAGQHAHPPGVLPHARVGFQGTSVGRSVGL